MKNNGLASLKESSIWLKHGNIKPQEEASLSLLQDRNLFTGASGLCPHCKASSKTVDHLATKCNRMVGHDYTRRHNEVVRCTHLHLCNKFNIKKSKKMRNHSVQEIVANEDVEIRVDTRIKTEVKIQNDRPDIFIYNKKKKEIIIIEIGITN